MHLRYYQSIRVNYLYFCCCSEAEDELIPYLSHLNLRPNIAFFNKLIKARALRDEHERGIATLELMKEWAVTPDILTFGCLALCCTNLRAANQLMADLKAFGSRLNVEIMTALMQKAAHNTSPKEMAAYLAVVEREGLTPNSRMLAVLEKFYQTYRGWIRDKEAGGYVPYPVVLEMRADLRHWRTFAASYRDWLARTPADLTSDPWDQYKISKDLEREGKKRQLAGRRK